MTVATKELTVRLRAFERHPKALEFIRSPAKRKLARSGRRGAKTTAAATLAVERFLAGGRVLYAVPTESQLEGFWFEVKRALAEPLDAAVYAKNESMHFVEVPNTRQRIRAKTAYDADTLRGDFADLLILDEIQHMHRAAWEDVGAPMLLDRDGDAVFLYTPLSPASAARHPVLDPRFARDLWKLAEEDVTGLWATFAWTSHDNGYISQEALQHIAAGMRTTSYRREILAEELDEVEGAIWQRETIERSRVREAPTLHRVVVGVDPPGGITECGIVVAGRAENNHLFVLADSSLRSSPEGWAQRVLNSYEEHKADRILGEANYGGDMVEATINSVARAQGKVVSYSHVQATRGKAVRAEPMAARYEKGEVHHVGVFPKLEDEMCSWVPGQSGQSPNRMDALVWALTDLTGGRANLRWLT